MRGFGVWLLVVVMTFGVAGCGGEPDPKEAAADITASRAKVVAELRDASAAMVAAGLTVEDLTGSYNTCGSTRLGGKAATFSGGGRVVGADGNVADQVNAVVVALVDAGWSVERAKTSRAEGYARLTRKKLNLSVDPDPLIGSSNPVFGVSGGCVDVTEDQFSDLPIGRKPITP